MPQRAPTYTYTKGSWESLKTVWSHWARRGQRAWLRLEKGVTICGRRMRQTHLPHVYVEWSGRQQTQVMTKRYTAPAEERELESMRLEWSYLRGRDDYMLRRDIQDATAKGCWMKGTFTELRQSQAAGREGPGGVASYFGVGHLVVRSGEPPMWHDVGW